MELILVRHGATPWTAVRRYQGQTDIPLSEEGEAQAVELRSILEPLVRPDTIVYSSDLSRARRTAELALPGASTILEPRLREIRFGVFEGLTLDENRERFPDLFPKWQEHAEYVNAPGGEPLHELRSRLLEWLQEVEAEHVIAFTHGGAIRTLLGVWLNCSWNSSLIGRIAPAHARAVRLDSSRLRLVDGPIALNAA